MQVVIAVTTSYLHRWYYTVIDFIRIFTFHSGRESIATCSATKQHRNSLSGKQLSQAYVNNAFPHLGLVWCQQRLLEHKQPLELPQV